MALNLGKMSNKELDDLIAQASAERTAKRQEQIAATRVEIEALLEERGFTLKEVFGRVGAPGKRASSGKAKFRNPADPSQTWSGWGKRPRWFVDAIKSGVSEEALLVKPGRKPPTTSKKARATTKAAAAKGRGAQGASKAVKSRGAKPGGQPKRSKGK